MPLGEGAWPLQPEPMPASPPRPQRAPQPPVVEETMQWQVEPEQPPPPAPLPRQSRAIDPLAGLAAELSRNPPPQPDAVIPPPRPMRERAPAREREAAREQEPPAPPPRERVAARAPQQAAAPVEAPFASAADQNLAEMAQRLEAALRRPGAKALEPRPAEPKAAAPAPQPEPPPAPPVEVEHEEPAAPAPVAAAEPGPEPVEFKPVRGTKSAQAKSPYDSLEQEMASLLGRPNSKS
jgi:flagellar protein FliO/FliZ